MQQHLAALLAVLAAAGITAFVGGASADATAPYCVLYPDPGVPVRASLADDRLDFSTVVQLTAVGETATQALSLTDRTSAALAPPLVVEGRTAWRPELIEGQPVRRDDDLVVPLFYAVMRFRLRSTPQ